MVRSMLIPSVFGIDKEQAEAFIGLGGDNQGIGDVAIQHQRLGPVELEAVTAAFRAGFDAVGGVFGPFVDGQRQDGFASGDLG